MPHYAYVATDTEGASSQGTVEAQSPQAAHQMLRDRGLVVSELTVAATRKGGSSGRVKLREIMVFSRQLAAMVNAGMNLMKCLDILQGQVRDPRLGKIITQVKNDVQSGQTLSKALGKHPGAFNSLYVNMIRAAEEGGVLDEILNRLAGYLERDAETRQKVKSAMVYPSIVLGFSLLMTGILVFFILPKFGSIFSELDVELPITTKLLLNASGNAVRYFYVPIILVLGTVFGYKAYARTPAGRYNIDSLKLKIPLFGELLRKLSIARFARTLSTLMKSGVKTPHGLEIVASTSGNAVIERTVLTARDYVLRGERLSAPLGNGGIFPDMVVQMIAVGEETGHVDDMLLKIADFYETEVEATIKALTSIIEPVLIVVLGVLVGFVAVSVISPIYDLVGQASQGKF
ncbi:MAG: type II secretion system F family protein [Armatimonadetes bacterium]|nr:type II secretion system F family protein [Armatimonadota bacterium]